MNIRTKLLELARVIADQAKNDPDFARQIGEVFGLEPATGERSIDAVPTKGRPRNRRPPAVLDPVALALDGEQSLRSRLVSLSLDQLRDIVADHGMDPGKLVMKWKSPERVIDRIVEISLSRAQKGDAFRSE